MSSFITFCITKYKELPSITLYQDIMKGIENVYPMRRYVQDLLSVHVLQSIIKIKMWLNPYS